MACKRYSAEEIVKNKLREAEVFIAGGMTIGWPASN